MAMDTLAIELSGKRSTASRQLLLELLREAEVRLAVYCPKCRQRMLGSGADAVRRREITEGR